VKVKKSEGTRCDPRGGRGLGPANYFTGSI
jgi:hypothetical protein